MRLRTPVARVVASGIRLEEQRSSLLEGNQHHRRPKRTHLCVLRVDLRDVRESSRQDVDRHLVAELVLEVGSLAARSLHLRVAVGDDARDGAADRLGDAEQAGHGTGIQQLVWYLLLANDDRILGSTHADRRHACLTDRLEGVLHLVQPAFRGKDGDVPVEACASAARHGGKE